MAYREFKDSAGTAWVVWDTHPARAETLEPDWRDGWLTFQADGTRRRLAPVPKGWTEATPERLELMCKAAQPSVRETPARGIESSALE